MIRPLLLKIRRRLAWQAFSRYAVYHGVVAGVVLFGIILFAPQHLAVGAGVLALITVLTAALMAFLSRPSLVEVAQRMDAAAATKDRLITALKFGEETTAQASPEWRQSVLRECETFLSKIDFNTHAPWRFPREGRWLALPAVAIAALSLFQNWPTLVSGGPVERPPDARIVQKAEELEKMAEKMEQSGQETDKKIAEALKKAAEQLRAEATSETPEKALLRELSALEHALQDARQGGGDVQSIAKAFEKAESLSRTAEALKKGEMAEAADELEQAAQKMREMLEQMKQEEGQSVAGQQGEQNQQGQNGEQGEQGESREASRFEKAMRAAARQLGEKSPMGEAASQAADSAQRREGEGVEQAMQRMADSLRRSRPGQQQDPAKAQAQIDASIARLREMKSGEQGGEGGQMAQAQAQGQGNSNKPGEGQQGGGEDAGGQPGSELDEGSKASPFGKEEGESAQQSLASQLQGFLGEGESLHSLTPTHGGKDEARRSYKALYEAAAPEAEEALDRENIPIGSRIYVKRYFEAIRPKQ